MLFAVLFNLQLDILICGDRAFSGKNNVQFNNMETLENAKEQRKDVGKAGVKQTVSTRDKLRKRICQSMYELEYLQMYK